MRILMKKMLKALTLALYMVLTPVCFALGKLISLFNKSWRNLWIVAERGTDARDNGYHFFKYMCERHPERPCVYIIDFDSADYQKVASLGTVVRYRSVKHFLMFACAKCRISTHEMGFSPDILLFDRIHRMGLLPGKNICLQHGIVTERIPWLRYDLHKVDLFVCSAQREVDFMRSVYQYPQNVAQLLGLCRYDALLEPCPIKRNIVLMPTWRALFRKQDSREYFVNSSYYHAFMSLLHSPVLIAMLEKYNYNLIFYPHYEVQKYLSDFTTGSERIKLGSFQEYDVQELIKSSAAMITDYSSVYLDFAYLHKPVLFYKFDLEEHNRYHHQDGYIDWARDAFGAVSLTEDDLLKEIQKLFDDKLKMPKLYSDRVDAFFTLHDRNNCERNYQAILKLATAQGEDIRHENP